MTQNQEIAGTILEQIGGAPVSGDDRCQELNRNRERLGIQAAVELRKARNQLRSNSTDAQRRLHGDVLQGPGIERHEDRGTRRHLLRHASGLFFD